MTFARRRALVATALLSTPLSFAAGCATPIVEEAGGFRHARHGYRIAAPEASGPAWRRVEVDGSDLAFRAGRVWMTLASRCGIPLGRPEILARHLRIGIPEHTLRDAGPVDADGLAGWQQVFDASRDGAVVRVKTVTLLLGSCALDAMLSARDAAAWDAALPAFERWWRTLRPVA